MLSEWWLAAAAASCSCVAASVASYVLFACSGARVSGGVVVGALSILLVSMLQPLLREAELLELLAIAYPLGIGLSLAVAFAQVRAAMRSAEVVGEVDGVPIYLCISRRPAFTFYPMKRVFLSRALSTLLGRRELEAVALHEYGHQRDPYRVVNLAVAALATLCLSLSALSVLSYPSPSVALPVALSAYACLTSIKSSTWIFEHLADRYAASRGRGLELCTSLIKVYACARLGKLCAFAPLAALESPSIAAALASSFSLARAALSILSPKPSLHPPLEARIALVLNTAWSGASADALSLSSGRVIGGIAG